MSSIGSACSQNLSVGRQTLHSRCQRAWPEPGANCDFLYAIATTFGWWSQTGSNRRPHACKARALPTELWPLGSVVRSAAARRLVGPGRLELPTLRLSGVRSNHLSYGPMRRRSGVEAPWARDRVTRHMRARRDERKMERETKTADDPHL